METTLKWGHFLFYPVGSLILRFHCSCQKIPFVLIIFFRGRGWEGGLQNFSDPVGVLNKHPYSFNTLVWVAHVNHYKWPKHTGAGHVARISFRAIFATSLLHKDISRMCAKCFLNNWKYSWNLSIQLLFFDQSMVFIKFLCETVCTHHLLFLFLLDLMYKNDSSRKSSSSVDEDCLDHSFFAKTRSMSWES